MPLLIESQNVEFKRSWRDEYLKTISAFANTEGGKFYIGVDDFGNVVGAEDIIRLLEDLPNKINSKLSILPSVIDKEENNLRYIEISVEESSVPISYNGKYYIRSGSTTHELNGNALIEFLQRKTGRTWDGISNLEYKKGLIDEETILKFINRAQDRIPSIGEEKDFQQVLQKLYLVSDNKIKNAGILLFAKNPQEQFIQSKIKIGKFINDADIQIQDIIEHNLFKQVLNSIEILTTKYLKRNIKFESDKIERKDDLEYPIEALREAVLNAIVHRDYSSSANILIRVYEDKLMIMNPGLLPHEVSLQSLKTTHISKPRNPYIADVFQKAGYIESWGRGTNKIVQAFKDAGLPEPEFSNDKDVFTVTFFKDRFDEKSLKHAGLNARQIRAVLYIKKEGKITNSEYQKINEIQKRQASDDLEELITKGLITKIGTTGKGTHYKLKGH